VQQRGQGEVNSEAVVEELRIAVAVHDGGFNLVVGSDQKPIPLKPDGAGSALDYGRLADELRAVKRQHPDKSDVQILSSDAMVFDTLVKTMDAVMSAGFPAVSLLDAASG
jgi:biopolymer transport protein ExbD